MSLNQEIAAFLATAEPRPAASKLEPYAELIRTLRQRRWTFAQIAVALRERFGLSVAASTIHNFIKVRARRKPTDELAKQPEQAQASQPLAATPKRPRFHLDA